MSDEKKRDDYTLDIDDSASRHSPNRFEAMAPSRSASSHSLTNSPMLSILSYCVSSILMTCTNKYILGGMDYNLNFFLLCVQVSVEQPKDAFAG
jgi:GDP-mannose transporter